MIPGIDIKNGQCVRLKQGEMSDVTVFYKDPTDAAKRWVQEGAKRLHLVDLDGAVSGKPVHIDLVKKISENFPNIEIQVGGGIRDIQTVQAYVDAGVNFVVLGTKAIQDVTFLKEVSHKFPKQIILGVDARNGILAVDGWKTQTDVHVQDFLEEVNDLPLAAIVYTDIMRDGMRTGVNVVETVKLATATSIPVIASGGVYSLDDLSGLQKEMVAKKVQLLGVISGRALYDGLFAFADGLSLLESFPES